MRIILNLTFFLQVTTGQTGDKHGGGGVGLPFVKIHL
jgi:hypothetical protein